MATNEKIIYIPARQKNAAIGGHVAGTEDIIDDVLGKEQNQINVETNERVSTLEENVGTGGSVDERIAAEGARHYLKEDTYNKVELNNMITTPNQEYVSVTATVQTVVVTDVLPITGAADTTYRVGNWDGTQYNDSVFSEYAWNGSTYIKLSTKSQVGEVYDISANHDNTKYANLAAALGTNGANVPSGIRRGGMSVKYIQSSDNKYVRYNLIANEFTTDVTQWAIDDVGVYVENPEFVYVKTDAENKILWAIKTDGSIYYGAGVPQQVIDYINKRIAELSLDEYEDIVAFLDDLEKGDKTLQMLLNEKVDKEEGKSLIDTEIAESLHFIENPEYLDIKTDNEDKILEAITKKGRKKINIPIDTPSASFEAQDNPEWMKVETDSEGKILGGRKKDGTLVENVGIESPTITDILNRIKDAKKDYILVAASNSNSDIKSISDFVCSGANDELTIQSAIDYAVSSNISVVKFANGLYNIDSFPQTAYDYSAESEEDTVRNVAILIPSPWKEISLIGESCEYGFQNDYRNGVCFYVTQAAMDSVDATPVSVLRCGASSKSILSGCAVVIEKIGFVSYGSQKPITMLDCTGGDRIYAKQLTFIGYGNELLNDSRVGRLIPPVAIPVSGFVGIKMGNGSNDPQGYRFDNIGVWGFYEGFKVGGEHTILIGCAATICVYGWTFGNYDFPSKNSIVHPITMINCCDERNQYLMQLVDCGYHQEVTMINHNIECLPSYTPGGVVISKMRASENFCGQITFTAMTSYSRSETGGSRKDFQLWEDGQGHTFKTINAAHRLAGTTAERNTYYPTYMQQYYDTTLNKLITCVDENNKVWVDTDGNIIN